MWPPPFPCRNSRASRTRGRATTPLRGRSYLGGMATNPLRRALRRQTLILADRVTANYRTPTPTVREAQWTAAASALARAVADDPQDGTIRGTLRYAEGHLHADQRRGRPVASATGAGAAGLRRRGHGVSRRRRTAVRLARPLSRPRAHVHLRPRRHRPRRRRAEPGAEAWLQAGIARDPAARRRLSRCRATRSIGPRPRSRACRRRRSSWSARATPTRRRSSTTRRLPTRLPFQPKSGIPNDAWRRSSAGVSSSRAGRGTSPSPFQARGSGRRGQTEMPDTHGRDVHERGRTRPSPGPTERHDQRRSRRARRCHARVDRCAGAHVR